MASFNKWTADILRKRLALFHPLNLDNSLYVGITKQSDIERLSYIIAKGIEGEEGDFPWKYWHDEYRPAEQIPLAWHYYYGVGCEKNVEYAKQLMRWSCREDGTYSRLALSKLIKEMGLDSELKFVTYKEHYNQNNDE